MKHNRNWSGFPSYYARRASFQFLYLCKDDMYQFKNVYIDFVSP